jgi:hypothetical protein
MGVNEGSHISHPSKEEMKLKKIMMSKNFATSSKVQVRKLPPLFSWLAELAT